MQRIIHKGWMEWKAKAVKDGIEVKTGNSRVNTDGHYLVLLSEIDFLNANPIRYALTVSPTIYVSCIKQFWSTAKIKTVNNETQIHAKVEGKTIVISESSVRRDLQFDDEDEVGEGSGHPTDPQHTSTTASPSQVEPITVLLSSQPKKTYRPRKAKSPQETGSGNGPRCQDTILGDAEAQLVLDLETTKTTQAKKIASLKKRVKNLERKRKSKTLRISLFKIGTSKRRSLGEEDASKQGRNLNQGKQSSIFEESYFDDEGFDADIDEVFKDVERDAEQVISAVVDEVPTGDAVNTAVTIVGVSVSTVEPITTASVNITIAESTTPPITTTTITIIEDEDLIITQTLVKIRSEKSKVQAKPEEEERLARERKEDANIAEWDNIQAMIDADYELAA
ncbi:hypothetical protein Tco_0726255 [Tanacetum coccineum]|uniref:Uncharacterized protein n=1 Tax=Tanacetum coccineum TaxID=301880 RepID=A0ABQ4YF26_9ASTR